jgi:predicted nucleic acid-binding protein
MTGVLVETDLIVEYLTSNGDEPALLRLLLQSVPCYTTLVQAAEIYSAVVDDDERRIVDRALFGLKILGASSRYAKTMGETLSSVAAGDRYRYAMVAALAVESQLPVVTDVHGPVLSTIPGVHVIAAGSLRHTTGPEEFMALLGNVLKNKA